MSARRRKQSVMLIALGLSLSLVTLLGVQMTALAEPPAGDEASAVQEEEISEEASEVGGASSEDDSVAAEGDGAGAAATIETEDEFVGDPIPDEQLDAIIPVGDSSVATDEDDVLYEMSSGASSPQELGFMPFRGYIWPLSSGTGFCYGMLDEKNTRREVLDIYRYTIASGESELMGSIAVSKYPPDETSWNCVLRKYDFDCFVSPDDKLYYIDASHIDDRNAYTLMRLDLRNGSKTALFTKFYSEIASCEAIGVDPQGRIYWSDYYGSTLYVLDQSGSLISTTKVPTFTFRDGEPAVLERGSFIGFDANSGNFIYQGSSSIRTAFGEYVVNCAFIGNTNNGSPILNPNPVSVLYQGGNRDHWNPVERLDDHYVANLTPFTGDILNVIDLSATDVNDVGDLGLALDLNLGGYTMQSTALPEKDIAFSIFTHDPVIAKDPDISFNTQDISGVGARCAYFPSNDYLVVDKGSRNAMIYKMNTGDALARVVTVHDIYKLMNINGELVALTRDEEGPLYLERFTLRMPTSVKLNGPMTLGVGDKADYTVTATQTDVVPTATYTTSDPSILSIDENGKAAANSEGTVRVTATTCNGLTETLTVRVRGGGVNKTLPDVTALSGTKVENWKFNEYAGASKPVTSYLAWTSSGLMRVQVSASDVLVERLTSAGQVSSSKRIAFELPLFGGYFAGADGSNYLVFGQKNTNESDDVTVMRVVRYDSSWNRLGACEIKGINTACPFDAGSLRMAEDSGRLYIHTCHTMYKNDGGINHQANMTFVINESDMSLADSYTNSMNLSKGYVSHSFNQFIRVHDDVIYRVDHGDLYPRGIALTATNVSDSIDNPFQYYCSVSFKDENGGNYTGATVGGMEVSDTKVLIAYGEVVESGSDVSNVFVATESLDLKGAAHVIQVTDYDASSETTCGNPQLVRVNDRHFLLMWAEHNKTTDAYCAQFALLDHTGNVVAGPVRKVLPLSDCQPIVIGDGSVAWYVSSDNKVTLYTINPYDLESMSDDNFDNKLLANLSKATVSSPGDQNYTGEPLTPKPKVTLNGSQLVEGVDYKLSYKNNTEIGTATITVTGIGSYGGTKSVTFRIREPRAGWKRLYGNGSLDTMSAIVNEGWDNGCGGTVVVARNDDFKDALAGAGLAGLTGGPIVLTGRYKLAPQAAAQLKRLKPSRVYVAGGTGALKPAVIDGIKAATGLPVRDDNSTAATGIIRLWGDGSAETSAALAYAGAGGWADGTAIIATNKSFKDALSAAPISYAQHWPILLATNGKELSYEVLWALEDMDIERVYIVGGTAAVSANVEQQLEDWGFEVADRKWGKNGCETSRVIADWGLSLGLSPNGMGYATSQKFPDALAGAALLGRSGSVLLLADEKAQGNLSFARSHAAEISYGYVFGGPLAFSEECFNKLP